MEGAQDEVSGEGGLDGDACGFLVPNFSDHDDVGVLSEDVSEAMGEGESDFGFDLHLADGVELILDGVLDGEDV